VVISLTGLSADRIRIAADGTGLTPDGNAYQFYLFRRTSTARRRA
jgi:hypothetical protein